MGICFSTRGKKKKKNKTTEPSSSSSSSSCSQVPPPPAAVASVVISPPPAAVAEAEVSLRPEAPSEEATPAPNALPCSSKPTADHAPLAHPPQSSKSEETPSKKPIFLITPSKTRKPASSEAADDPLPPAARRTSSCTKEEVESILIQCGRLSRSSSGNADGTARRYSGSKRSFDFDAERKDGDDWERSLNSSARPSPRRRAQSRERESGGGRRVSRSPGRRTEQQQVTTGSRPQQQPGKMVSVPAREKSSASGPERRTGPHRSGPMRSSSPRSRSPGITRMTANENCHQHHNNAHGSSQQQPLSRSSWRKAEQSPCRRNPMAEIDDNQPPLGLAGEGLKKKKVPQNPPQSLPPQRSKSEEDQQQQADLLPPPMDPKPITRSRSSRRSSRDLDAILGNLPASSYASQLLEDINNYHQSATPFSLPACVSKACSILDAVADLNHDSFSSNGQPGSRASSQKHSFTEADFSQSQSQSFHNKYVSVRNKSVGAGESEPQESAGSNSFVGQQQWGVGSCQGNAGEPSSEQCWTSSWSGQEEEVEGGVSNSCSGQKGGSSSVGSGRRMELENQRRMRRGIVGGAGTTVARACSAPVAAATSSATSY